MKQLTREEIKNGAQPQIVQTLLDVSNYEGLVDEDLNKPELMIRGRYIDEYLLLAVLARRISIGDIELKFVSDKENLGAYTNKLLTSVGKIMLGDVK